MSYTNGNGNGNGHRPKPKNVLGTDLKCCCLQPLTGWFRDGNCRTNDQDRGMHTICAKVTAEFLLYLQSQGNDLITPAPQFNFPGLVAGDKWCVCAMSWYDAYQNGVACPIVLEACDSSVLKYIPLSVLQENALTED
ncbi:MAG: DUF2237 domain-containing protein [Pyrinomonadaceae bacterium]|jgi:uncharacterized protein|nr:DUF2237 domain-containing protein [Pyrinomonadaceae bacterium]